MVHNLQRHSNGYSSKYKSDGGGNYIHTGQNYRNRIDHVKQKLSLQPTHTPVVYCDSNSDLNDELIFWHLELQQGNIIAQIEIDRRLFVLSMMEANIPLRSVPPSALYLSYRDTLHANNLPDLIWIFRDRLIHGVYNTALQDSIFRYSIPCIRKTKHPFSGKLSGATPEQTVDSLCSVYINIAYGTMLALFPHCCKSPTFNIRKQLFRKFYTLSISSLEIQHEFIIKHINLMRLCFMEYFVFVLEKFCNVERNLMGKCLNYDVYTNLCQTSCDLFRQNCLQSDAIDWTYIDNIAFKTTDKIIRTTRIGIKLSANVGNIIGIRKLGAVWSGNPITTELTRRLVFEMPPCFWISHNMFLYTQMITQWLSERDIEHCVATLSHNVSVVHQMIHVYQMPSNIVMRQVQALLKHFNGDSMLLNSVCKKSICLKCICNIKQASSAHTILNNSRMCLQSCELRCNKCSNSDSLVTINMLGKMLQIERHMYFICPFCIKVHLWNSTGTEFMSCAAMSTAIETKKNGHIVRPTPKRSGKRQYTCFVCQKQSNTINMSLVDVANFKMKNISLCSKHYVPLHFHRFITNVRHLHKYFNAIGVQLANVS
jgi:hypothetical protein